MHSRNPNSAITAETFEGMKSSDAGHVRAVASIPTSGRQTSTNSYVSENLTKPSRQEEDWLAHQPLKAEFGMCKNDTEATGGISYNKTIEKHKTILSRVDSSCHSTSAGEVITASMHIPACLHFSVPTVQSLKTAMRSAPVTVSTLGELNLTWMMHYINLRCDINFDHDLHFTPIKGSRGEEKRRQAVGYWHALEAELTIYQHDSRKCQNCEKDSSGSFEMFQPRLSAMFQDLKDLLETLVPDKDHDQVKANLDIDLITQQVENGVLDVARLSKWLARLLKCHCAPMRDESAEAMAEQLEYGANNGNLSTLIDGLESLFSFLEGMKLDVANHQIRTFRYVLIDETITFQQSYFHKRIDNGKLDITAAKAWYRDAHSRYLKWDALSAKGEESRCFEIFMHGLVQLCSSTSRDQPLPVTLSYDQGRMQQLRADVQDTIVLRLCISVFNELLSRLRCQNHIPPLAYLTLQGRLMTIADDEPAQHTFVPWGEKLEEMAVEITRAAFVAAHFPLPPRIPAEAFDRTRCRLQKLIDDCYTLLEEQLLMHLTTETIRHADDFQKMSTLAMSETQKQYQLSRQSRGDNMTLPDLENTARMLAHMGVLHWQVWRDLAYMQVENRSRSASEENAEEQVFPEPFGGNERSPEETVMTDRLSEAQIERQAGHTWDNS